MKKILTLSAIAAVAISSFAVAGGDIAPIKEPAVVAESIEVVDTDAGFYVGLAYGALSHERHRNTYRENVTPNTIDTTYSEVMLQAGYKFNPYIAVEGRYWFGLEDNLEGEYIDYVGGIIDASVDVWALYVKPMYPVTEELDVYALLGYGSAEYDTTEAGTRHISRSLAMTFDGFTWGLGASYAFNNNVSVFVDYTRIYDDTTDFVTLSQIALNFDDTIDIVNVGVTYKF